jgi:antitoxin component of RelBE/YafQ-DinJ toxin-antitoxin module
MRVTKDATIKARITAEMQQQIYEYCRKHNMTVSEFVRFACSEIFAATGTDKLEQEKEKARVEKVKALIEKSKALYTEYIGND